MKAARGLSRERSDRRADVQGHFAPDPSGLMELVARGDLAAFERLYESHVNLVYGVALRILRTETAAEDVTQSVFLKVWTKPSSFRSGNFATWIARVARNRAIDEIRRGKRTAELSDFAADAALDEVVIARVEAERARAIIATLPVEQRRAIEMAFFGGMTHQEVAFETGAPLGTVKTRIRSGLTALRDAFTTSLAR